MDLFLPGADGAGAVSAETLLNYFRAAPADDASRGAGRQIPGRPVTPTTARDLIRTKIQRKFAAGLLTQGVPGVPQDPFAPHR